MAKFAKVAVIPAPIEFDINKIVIGKVTLERVPLDTKFTVLQNQIVRGIVSKIYGGLLAGSSHLEFAKELFTFGYDADILALIYLQKDTKFTREQYEFQKELILNSTIDTSLYADVISDFLAGTGKSVLQDSLTTMNKINQALTR